MQKPVVKFQKTIEKPVVKYKKPETQLASPAAVQTARISSDAWTRATPEQTKVPASAQSGFLNRAGKTVSGGVKGSAANFANALGTTQAVAGGVMRKNYLTADVQQAQKDLARYQYQAENASDDAERDYFLREAQKVRESLDMAQENLKQTETAGQSTMRLADRLQESSAQDIAEAKEGLGKGGQFAVDAGAALTQLAGDALTGGLPATFVRGAGSAAQQARQSGAGLGDQVAYGLGSGLLSVATEKIANVAGPFKKAFGAGVLDDAIGKATEKLGNSAAGKLVLSAISEGGEEFAEALFQPVLQRATYDPEAQFDLSEALYDAAIGGVLGGLGGTVDVVSRRQDIMPQLTADRETEWNRMLETVTPKRRNSFTQAERIARNFGATLNVENLGNGAAGEYQNGTITIDPTAENPVRQVLVHELTHHMETSGLYDDFSRKIMGFIAEDLGVDVDALKQSITDEYGRYGVELDGDSAGRELVAKFAESKLFQDERSIRRLLRTDRNLFQRVYDWIRDTVAKVRGTSEERFLIDAQRLYEKALRQAGTREGAGVAQNTFGSVNARTADLSALQTARELEQRGSDADAIRQQTGWYRGMDGKWRFEIDDSGMQYYSGGDARFRQNHPEYEEYQGLLEKLFYGSVTNEEYVRLQKLEEIWGRESGRLSERVDRGNARLDDILQHDDLFQAYPELKKARVIFADMDARQGANYNPRTNTITINSDMRDAPEGEIIHEVQHAIQNLEGFAKGTNREYWERRMVDDDYSRRWSGSYEEMMPSDLYRNTAGEIEARDAAARRRLTPEQRAQRMPDLGDENTVFVGQNGSRGMELFSSEDVPDSQGAVAILRENMAEVGAMEPVATVSGMELPAEGRPTDRAMAYLESIGGKVNRPGFGDVLFSKSKVRNSLLGHGFGVPKMELMAAVPGVIRDGKQIGYKENWKGRGYDSFVFAAPVEYRGETAYVTAIVIRDAANRYYLHEAVDQNGDLIFGQNKSPDTASDGSADKPQNTVAGSELSDFSIAENDAGSNGKFVDEDIMPKLTRHDEEQFSMGRSFDELLQNQRDGVELGSTGQLNMRGFDADIGPDIMPKLEDVQMPGAETTAQPGGSDADGYMEALARDENELTDPVTPSDIVYDAKLRSLQQEEAPPEDPREPVAKRDLDELVQLYQDIANPVDTARSARFEESEALVSARTPKEEKSLRQQASEAKSYFMRKMVDAGDSVTRVGKAVKDDYLYPFYNMARSSASAGINMIQNEQTDITGKHVGESLNDIFAPIREQGDKYYEQFQTYLYDLHNIDRMNLVKGDNTAKLEAELALREFDRENPDVATLTEARLQRKAESIDEEEAALARERIRLLRKVNQADKMGNKPVFGWEVTADMSRERSDQLLRDHPEFAQYRDQVRQYIKNLMQYRVDSGLMTQEDAAFLEKYYPNYVPTFRQTEKGPRARNRKSLQVGKTVGLAEGGNQKLVPIHEALGKQTMQVVREGSKNRFGARLLENFSNHSHDEKMRQYVLDAQEYESDFSTETFDEPEIELKKENTFTVYKDGKMYEMTVDPSMFDAVKALYPDVKESNLLVKAIRAGNNLFKSLVTGYNPTFTIRNTVRDLQTAGMYSRNAVTFARNYPKALREISENGDFWKQYKALGGSFSSMFDYQTGTVKEPDGKVAKMAAKMEALNMAMEQAPRLAEFMSVVEAGDGSMENLMDAMHAAADVTVNFGRSGTFGKILNANYIPFLNPGIQGFDKMIRRVAETKGGKEWAKLAVRAAALGVAPSVLNGLLYSDDEDWEDLRDSDKDTNYMFKIGDGVWLKIPKGRELSILGMTADRIQDVVNGEDVDWRDFITTVGNQVAPASPLEENILKDWLATDLFDPSSPGRTWYGGDIESQRLRNYAPGERYDSSTDVFSKWVGQQLNLSPKKINYLLDQYTGVVGDFVLPLLTPQAERDMFTKAFTVDSVSSNKISGEFYDKSDELTYAKNGGDTVAKVVSRFWSKQQSVCSDLYTEIREIEGSSLPDVEKKKKVRESRAVLNGIQKNALTVLDTYEATVKKYLHGNSDEAVEKAYREANRECFGAEYALEVYNKDTHEKAKQAYQNGVSYDDFYTYYFDTKAYITSGDKSVATKKMEYLQKADLSETAKAELYFADIASDSDLKKQAELENSNGITAEEYWRYKVATVGMSKKAEKLVAIDSLDLTPNQKTALYFANNWAESTLDEAPWLSKINSWVGPDLVSEVLGISG